MAHRGSFRGRGISKSQRRKKSWEGFNVLTVDDDNVGSVLTAQMNFAETGSIQNTNPVQLSTGFAFAAGQTAGEIRPESTLIRIRGSLNMVKNAISGVTNTVVAFGIGVMETGAVFAGAFPNPASPAGRDWDGWMFYRSIQTSILDAEASIVDVKSMRIIQSGYSLFFAMGEYKSTSDDTTLSTANTSGEFSGRGLFLLP